MVEPAEEGPAAHGPTAPVEEPFYEKNGVYEITINPNDIQQFYKMSDRRTYDRLSEVTENWRKKCLKHLAPCAEYTVIVEISEPKVVIGDQHRPRVHFHGIMTLKHPVKFLTEHLHVLALSASIAINKYRPDYWPLYIAKQKHLVQPLLGKAYYLTHKDTPITPFGAVEQASDRRSGR